VRLATEEQVARSDPYLTPAHQRRLIVRQFFAKNRELKIEFQAAPKADRKVEQRDQPTTY
jgi:hypothetical protein